MPQRNSDGKFAKGNTISKGKGRLPRHTEDDYMAVAIGSVSLDDWKAVVKRALIDAKKGDYQARKWLSSLLIGDKPNIAVMPVDNTIHFVWTDMNDNSGFNDD